MKEKEQVIFMNLLIKQVRLIDPSSNTDKTADILIENGIITNIKDSISPSSESAHEHKPSSGKDNFSGSIEIIDGNGLTAFPGLTDIHCHFRDPGWPEKETIESGAMAALAGGVTTVVCMANTKPVTDNPDVMQYIMKKTKKLPIKLLQNSAMTVGLAGNELVDAKAMLDAGACGFSDDGIPITSPQVMAEALKTVAGTNTILSVHEELPQLLFTAGINYGEISKKTGVGGAPDISESALIERDIMLQAEYGGHLHFQHVSTARSARLIKNAREMGQNITAEVTSQHLALTDDIVLSAGANAKINPPIRDEKNRQALLQGIVDGTFDVIVTDHAPHTVEDKQKGLVNSASGMIGLETSLSIAFETLVSSGLISRLKLAELMCCNGAKMYGFEKKIAVGEKADIALFDEKKVWKVEKFYSKSSNSPFLGKELTGKVLYTICNNEIFRFI